jgi:hypothetical protein
MAEPEGENEGRRHLRRRTILVGVLYCDSEKWECSIFDFSESGARVRGAGDLDIGTFVELKINKFNDFRQAKVMWRKGKFLGLEFLINFDHEKDEATKLLKPIGR